MSCWVHIMAFLYVYTEQKPLIIIFNFYFAKSWHSSSSYFFFSTFNVNKLLHFGRIDNNVYVIIYDSLFSWI